VLDCVVLYSIVLRLSTSMCVYLDVYYVYNGRMYLMDVLMDVQ
jgi:hypothetical protein